MNLVHLFNKRDPVLVSDAGVALCGQSVDGRRFSGLSVPPGQSIRVKSIFNWYPFCDGRVSTGWYVRSRTRENIRLHVSLRERDRVLAEQVLEADASPAALVLPMSSEGGIKKGPEIDVVVTNSAGSTNEALVLVSETVPVASLYDEATGVGCEIGPGLSPRILPAAGRTVFYLERETIEDWKSKYPGATARVESVNGGQAALHWEHYRIGRADDLPFDDGSLDFIFSAHVLEHLVNPLGHIHYWRGKLKAGGKVIAIVPQLHGCLDFRNRPTKIGDLLTQFELGGFRETAAHHAAYAAARHIDPEQLFAKGYSSHFSFFEPGNLTEIMNFAVQHLGFESFRIDAGENSKAMNFVLYA